MIGSFLTRVLVMVLGYAYPAYECYIAIEKNNLDIQQLRFWCQYWILVAALTISERVGDTFASWVPLYSETKLAIFIYLWFPKKTRGTTYVYASFFRPYVDEIYRNLVQLRTKAGDMAVIYGRKAVCYGQTRFTEILRLVVCYGQTIFTEILKLVRLQESTPKPQPKEKKETAPEEEEQKQPDVKAASQAASSSQPKESSTTEAEKAAEIVAALPATAIQSWKSETNMEETLRVTRGSLRRVRSTGTLKE